MKKILMVIFFTMFFSFTKAQDFYCHQSDYRDLSKIVCYRSPVKTITKEGEFSITTDRVVMTFFVLRKFSNKWFMVLKNDRSQMYYLFERKQTKHRDYLWLAFYPAPLNERLPRPERGIVLIISDNPLCSLCK